MVSVANAQEEEHTLVYLQYGILTISRIRSSSSEVSGSISVEPSASRQKTEVALSPSGGAVTVTAPAGSPLFPLKLMVRSPSRPMKLLKITVTSNDWIVLARRRALPPVVAPRSVCCDQRPTA